MNRAQADEIIRRVGNTWGSQIEPAMEPAWHLSLAPVSYEAGLAAVEWLRHRRPNPPAPRDVVEAAAEVKVAAPSSSGPRRGCRLCEGTGWREAVTEGGVPAVARCTCWGTTGDHPKGCTCRACIDPEGTDAARTGPEGDPLRFSRYGDSLL